MSKIVFSMPHQLRPIGPGRPISKMWEAVHAKYGDDAVRIVVDDLPMLSDPGRLGDGLGTAFDDLATDKLRDLEVHGFIGGGACLNQLYELGKPDEATVAPVTTWFSSHAEWAQRVLRAEYTRHSLMRDPVHPYLVWRALKEQEMSDFLIVPSEFCQSTYPKQVQEKCHVVGFGVDTDEFKPNPSPPPVDRLRIIMPATNPYRKGVAYAIEAFEQMDPKKIAPLLTGADFGGKYVRAKTTDLVIETPGWMRDEDMQRAYRESHVMLLPSLEEGQALAGLEAMACGLPVILTPETGHPIEDGKQGFFVPSRAPVFIRTALQYFIDNPGELARMGREARTYAEAHPWSKFQDGILSVLKEATI